MQCWLFPVSPISSVYNNKYNNSVKKPPTPKPAQPQNKNLMQFLTHFEKCFFLSLECHFATSVFFLLQNKEIILFSFEKYET